MASSIEGVRKKLVNGPDLFPEHVVIEDIRVDRFADAQRMIQRFVVEASQRDRTSVVLNLNINAANIAHRDLRYKQLLQTADAVFCDGAGIQLAAKLTGQAVPTKLGVGYWLIDALETFASEGVTVYMLGGEPGITEAFMAYLDENQVNHSIIGTHHGYLSKNPDVNRQAIEDINRLKPDVLFVGMGMPIQEFWVEQHKDELDVSLIIPVGAAMDYFAGKLEFCPPIFNNLGCEWLFRLYKEPRRLFKRYVLGNPSFLSRIVFRQIDQTARRWSPKREPITHPRAAALFELP